MNNIRNKLTAINVIERISVKQDYRCIISYYYY